MWPRRRIAARAALPALVLALAGCGGGEEPREPARPVAAAPDGRAVYELRCSPCHGMEGAGDGPAAAGITPRPRNFRDPDFWRGRTAEQLRLIVQQGKPGTLMPPFEGVLGGEEIDDVVRYLQTLRPASH